MVQSCSDKEAVDPTPEFNIDFISQKAWEGVLVTEYSDEDKNITDPFSILFTTDSRVPMRCLIQKKIRTSQVILGTSSMTSL